MIYINNKEKIKNIKFHQDNFYVVADFDKTLTEGNSNSTWAVMANSNQLGDEYTKKRTKLYEKYRPIEIDMSITDEEKSMFMTEWWKAHISLFKEYNLKENDIKKSITDGGLKYREGAKLFLKKMKEQNVPVIIISAGIGNVIEEFLKAENDYYDNIKIVSNFIEFKDGNYSSIKGEIIHALNKNIVCLDEKSKEELKGRENILLLGDGLPDLKMISEEQNKNAITVGFLEEKIDENLKYFNEGFDIVLTNQGTLNDVNKILNLYNF